MGKAVDQREGAADPDEQSEHGSPLGDGLMRRDCNPVERHGTQKARGTRQMTVGLPKSLETGSPRAREGRRAPGKRRALH